MAHNWKFKGCIPHNGEHWYECSLCGAEDWIASYGSRDQLMPAECKSQEKEMSSLSNRIRSAQIAAGESVVIKHLEELELKLSKKQVDEHKAVCLEALDMLLGDNLYRAKAAFARYTPEQMNKPYGQSDRTPAEILASYEAHEAKILAAKRWLEGI